jgi:predicted transcriptional regulator
MTQQLPSGFSRDTPPVGKQIVQEGTEDNLFHDLSLVLEQLGRGETVEPASVVYVTTETMRQILAASRTTLIEHIAKIKEAASIEVLAQNLHRGRSGVSRDVKLLEALGLLKVQERTISGHGRRKSIRLAHESMEVRLRLV